MKEPYWHRKNDKGTACVHMFIVQFAWLHQEKSKISVPGGFQGHFIFVFFCNKHRLGHWMVLVCVCPRWFVSSEKKKKKKLIYCIQLLRSLQKNEVKLHTTERTRKVLNFVLS